MFELMRMSGATPEDLLWALAVAVPFAAALLFVRLRRPAAALSVGLLDDRRRG